MIESSSRTRKLFHSTTTSKSTGKSHSSHPDPLQCEIKSSDSSKPKVTEAQREAGRKHYNHCRSMASFKRLIHFGDLITPEESRTINDIFLRYLDRHKAQRKSYVMCPRCRTAVVGKPFRKATKRTPTTHAYCDICNSPSEFPKFGDTSQMNRYTTRNQHTLASATRLVYDKHPELFL